MTLGFLGLGKMGSRMVTKLAADGHSVHVWNRTPDKAAAISGKNIFPHQTISELVAVLPTPKIIWIMLPAGEATQSVLDQVTADIVIDGGNSRFSDTEKRARAGFLGIGVSGGLFGSTQGYSLMAGGDRQSYDAIVPILDSLAKPSGGHAYVGPGGAGHYVKMVHNGIEYGIMQSFAEGFSLLSKSELDLEKIVSVWQKGSLVSGYLLDRIKDVVSEDFMNVEGAVHTSGEAEWMLEESKSKGLELPIIEASVEYRKTSQKDPRVAGGYIAKFLAKLRNVFGGHDTKKLS